MNLFTIIDKFSNFWHKSAFSAKIIAKTADFSGSIFLNHFIVVISAIHIFAPAYKVA